MSEGYIKLYRQLKDNFLWKSEKFTKAQAWIDILLSANHKDGGFEVRGIWVPVKRGQVARSELTMAEEWGWSREKVRRYLDRLESAEMLTVKRDNKTTIITVVNYDLYQGYDTANETPNQTPEKHQKNTKRDTNNNVKNVNNEKKKDIVTKPESVSEQIWNDWLLIRKNKKLPLTETALNGVIKQAEIAGMTLEQAIRTAGENGWAGFKAEWLNKPINQQNQAKRVYDELT